MACPGCKGRQEEGVEAAVDLKESLSEGRDQTAGASGSCDPGRAGKVPLLERARQARQRLCRALKAVGEDAGQEFPQKDAEPEQDQKTGEHEAVAQTGRETRCDSHQQVPLMLPV